VTGTKPLTTMQKDRETEIEIEIKRDWERRERQTRKWIENEGLFEI
jgi:hypothetical protein